MSNDSTRDHEVLRIRIRTLGYSIVQFSGLALVLWGFYAFLSDPLLSYYQAQLPDVVMTVDGMIPTLDGISAIIVFGLGAFVVHLSTRH